MTLPEKIRAERYLIPDTPAYRREYACDPSEACDRYGDDGL